MSGDDLTIALFLFGTAIAFGLTAVTLAGWTNRALVVSLFGVAAILFVCSIFWPTIGENWVGLKKFLQALIENYFVFRAVGLLIFLMFCFDFAIKMRWIPLNLDKITIDRAVTSSAANVSSPPRQLSSGDQRFREALRSFAISNLNDVLQNAANVFSYLQHIDRTKNEGQPEQKARDHFIHFATSANDFHYSKITELAKPEVEDIDADQLQNLIYDFFQEYQLFQKHIGSLNGVLKVNLLATEPMQRWVDADKQCRIELRKLKAWPQANRLKEIPESIFASSEDRIWSRAP